MKLKRVCFAIFVVVLSSVFVVAQTSPTRTTLSKGKDASGRDVVVITYSGLEKPNLRVYEGIINATSPASCFNNLNGNLQIADPIVAALAYDPVNGLYKLRWTLRAEGSGGCNVILVTDGDETINNSDLAVWRSSFGASGLREDIADEKGAEARSPSYGPVYRMIIDRRP